MHKKVNLWRNVGDFALQEWNALATEAGPFDVLAPAWHSLLQRCKEQPGLKEKLFGVLKREHALETGAVENLYSISRGVTQTLIAEGFLASFLAHNDASISTHLLLNYLGDNLNALEYVFDHIAQQRDLSEGFICDLHRLVTQHQTHTDGVVNGSVVKIPLTHGVFKQQAYNPARGNVSYAYCPPELVPDQINQFTQAVNDWIGRTEVHPVVLAAWAHYVFIVIHPFQDGNGRVARLLTSWVLLRYGLPPFTVRRLSSEVASKSKYLNALEAADAGKFQDFVGFVAEALCHSIELCLSIQPELPKVGLAVLSKQLAEMAQRKIADEATQREQKLASQREEVFQLVSNLWDQSVAEIESTLREAGINVTRKVVSYSDPEHHYFTHQIATLAIRHNYFFNRNLPRAWFSLRVAIQAYTYHDIVFTLHHSGYAPDVMQLGGFVQFSERDEEGHRPFECLAVRPISVALGASPTHIAPEAHKWLTAALEEALQAVMRSLVA